MRHITGNSSIRFFVTLVTIATIGTLGLCPQRTWAEPALRLAPQLRVQPMAVRPEIKLTAPIESAANPAMASRGDARSNLDNVQITPSKLHRKPDKIDEVANDFESLMLNYMYTQMKSSNRMIAAGDDNPFAPSHAEDIYRSMLDDEMMKRVAKGRPLGVADMVARQLRGESGVSAVDAAGSRKSALKVARRQEPAKPVKMPATAR